MTSPDRTATYDQPSTTWSAALLRADRRTVRDRIAETIVVVEPRRTAKTIECHRHDSHEDPRMDSESRRALAELLKGRATAALGTLHDGAPAVSMVPFVFSPALGLFVIHVSGLSQHTKDMKADPRVSLMVMEAEAGDKPAQALARLTLQGEAREVETTDALQAQARSAYLTRFPDASSLIELPGFSFFVILPVGARFVGGFARAFSVGPEELVTVLREA